MPDNITKENVIISLITQAEKALSDTEKLRDNMVGIGKAAKQAQSEVNKALRSEVIAKYTKAIAGTNKELQNMESLTKGVGDGLDEAFSGLDADQINSALLELSVTLDDLEEKGGTLEGIGAAFVKAQPEIEATNKAIEDTAEAVDKVGDELDDLPAKTKKGSKQAKVYESGWKKVMKNLKKVFATIGILFLINEAINGIRKLVSFARENNPQVAKSFAAIGDTLFTIGSYIAEVLAPILVRMANAIDAVLGQLDLRELGRVLAGIFVVAENIVNTFLGLFGLDIGDIVNGFVTGLKKVLSFANGIVLAVEEVFQQLKFSALLAFEAIITQGAKLPGKLGARFKESAANIKASRVEVAKEIEGVAVAFRRGFDEIDKMEVPDPPTTKLRKKTEEDKKAIEDAIVGTIRFYREQIELLAKDIENVDARTAAILVRTIEGLQENITQIESETRKRIAQAKGLDKELADIGSGGTFGEKLFGSATAGAQETLDELKRVVNAVANEDIKVVIEQQIDDIEKSIEASRKRLAASASSGIGAVPGLGAVAEVQSIAAGTPQISQLSDTILSDANEDAKTLEKQFEKLRQQAANWNNQLAQQDFSKLQELLQVLDDISFVLSAIQSGFNEVTSAVRQGVQAQIAAYDEFANVQQSRIEAAVLLADKGNSEILQSELERLDALNEAREEQVRKDQRLAAIEIAINSALAVSQGIVAVTKGFKDGPIAGIAAAVALAATIAATVISLKNTFSGVQGLKEGTPYVDGEGGIDKVPAMLTRGERVFTVDQNQQVGSLSNQGVLELVEKGKLYQDIEGNIFYQDPPELSSTVVETLSNQIISIGDEFEGALVETNRRLDGINDKLNTLSVAFNIDEKGVAAIVTTQQRQRKRVSQIRK